MSKIRGKEKVSWAQLIRLDWVRELVPLKTIRVTMKVEFLGSRNMNQL